MRALEVKTIVRLSTTTGAPTASEIAASTETRPDPRDDAGAAALPKPAAGGRAARLGRRRELEAAA